MNMGMLRRHAASPHASARASYRRAIARLRTVITGGGEAGGDENKKVSVVQDPSAKEDPSASVTVSELSGACHKIAIEEGVDTERVVCGAHVALFRRCQR